MATGVCAASNAELTDDEERAKDDAIGTEASRAPRHTVERLVSRLFLTLIS